jgi:DNA-directed RNA polymerase specialized sigma24 family protein
VAHAKREVLLRAYRHLLHRREDLEDCYSQATLELLAQAHRGSTFADSSHVANTLELRFLSRIRDVRRALGGRSPIQAAQASARSLGEHDQHESAVTDPRADLETLVMLRTELRCVAAAARCLSVDQRLVLASQLADTGCGEFCRRFGWSPDKYRKVAQRGRARLRVLMSGVDR